MKIKSTLFAVTAMLFPGYAMAQDATDVSGFRLEAIAGWDNVTSSVDDAPEFDSSDSGLLYGIGAGYDFAAGNFIVGIEAELAESTNGSSVTFNNEDIEGYIIDGTVALDASEDIYIGARLGTMIDRAGVFYVKGGYSMANAEFSAAGTIDGEPIDESVGFDLDGFRIGGGYEANLASNLYAKIEYRYTSYGSGSVNYDGTNFDADEAFDFINLDRHQAVIGIGYRF